MQKVVIMAAGFDAQREMRLTPIDKNEYTQDDFSPLVRRPPLSA
jgi:hypothetical protein